MTAETPRAARGRQAEAARNDERIADAAMAVFGRNAAASMGDVAAEAGVGVASLYRRFASKEDLVRALALRAMGAIEAAATEAVSAVDRGTDGAWAVFSGFLAAAMRVGAGSMTPFIGTFVAGDELNAAGLRLYEQIGRLVTAAQDAGAIRRDLTAADVLQLFEMLHALTVGEGERRVDLHHRFITLVTEGLGPTARPMPAGEPTWDEVLQVWNTRREP